MPEFFVLATKKVELRGRIRALSAKHAEKKARENWYIYDHPDHMNAVTAGSANKDVQKPLISEYEASIKIIHSEKIAEFK